MASSVAAENKTLKQKCFSWHKNDFQSGLYWWHTAHLHWTAPVWY